MKAIDNFDLSQNVKFSTYAVPMIIGEIRRYLRDNNSIRVSRSLRDIAYKALVVRDKLVKDNNKEPSISQVLEKGSEVILFTRPRRFGKSLNMSMLQRFFEIGTDPGLFGGLHISQNAELCEQHMGKYPVVAISLKGVNADSYTGAYNLVQ